jgi:hypothetical protein
VGWQKIKDRYDIRMLEAAPETIENTSDYDSESAGKGSKKAPDEIRRAIS